jgi:hypothetical protein
MWRQVGLLFPVALLLGGCPSEQTMTYITCSQEAEKASTNPTDKLVSVCMGIRGYSLKSVPQCYERVETSKTVTYMEFCYEKASIVSGLGRLFSPPVTSPQN